MSDACRFYLITPPLTAASAEAFARTFAAVLAKADFASALVKLAPGAEGDAKKIIAPLIDIAHGADIALLVERDARLAARIGADGAHIENGTGEGVDLTEAIASLHPDRIAGVGHLRLRDDAMNAGEAGADYVMFGEPRPDGWTPPPEETLERAAWWAEIFQTPCVAYASSLDQIAPLAAAGADFVALGDALWKAAS